ncbi:TPA: MarR family transcriptional regulator [Vibrio parahaemolyticus]|nr:MarR family transcriptional regulator [Vibrio parahaemolyticus]HCH5724713.1 MarR family transcriptional regulator [Vibrio parahaemolyticus]
MEIDDNQLERIAKTFGNDVVREVVAMGYIPTDKELFKIKKELDEAKNFDFTQINNKYTWDVIGVLAKENPNALQLLLFLGKNMDNYNAISCSQALLCEVLGKGRTTVHNTIKYLEAKGYISVGKQGNNNIYILNDTLFWKNKRTHHKYCQFGGSILLSKKENAKLFDKLEENREMEFSLTKSIKKKTRK